MLPMPQDGTHCKKFSTQSITIQEGLRSSIPMQLNMMTLKKRKNEDEDSNEEYVLISTLTGLVSHGSDTWLGDSGASIHMTGYKYYFQCLVQKGSPYKVNLGGDYQYPIKGMGESFYKLDYQCPRIEE